jgi:hypothetical protein
MLLGSVPADWGLHPSASDLGGAVAWLIEVAMMLLLALGMWLRIALLDVLPLGRLMLLLWTSPLTQGWGEWWLGLFSSAALVQFFQDVALWLGSQLLKAGGGDGSRRSGTFTAHGDDQAHLAEQLAPWGYTVNLGRGRVQQSVTTRGLSAHLRAAGVLHDKHVPPVYLRASAEQRLALLQGLMDTDGSADASKVEFSNTNRRLIDAVVELARSLGQKPRVLYGTARLAGRDCGPFWRVLWRPTLRSFGWRGSSPGWGRRMVSRDFGTIIA